MLDMESTTPQWLWWWFRFGIGLAAAAVGGGLLLLLLWRALRWIRTPREERERKRAEKEHLLTRVSGRGRTAYLVLCLENALVRFELPAADWEWVLQRLWALTEAPESQHQRLFEVCCLLPENVLPYERYEDLTARGLSDALLAVWNVSGGLPEERFQPLRDLYAAAGWRLCVLAPLLTAVYQAAALSWTAAEGGDRKALELVRKTEALLQNWSIPLPQGAGLTAIQKQRHTGWGPVFPGVRLSALLRTRTAEEAAAEAAAETARREAEKALQQASGKAPAGPEK